MNKFTLAFCPLLVSGAVFAGSYNVLPQDNTEEVSANDEFVTPRMSSHSAGPYAGVAMGWTKQTVNSSMVDDSDRNYLGGQINAGYSFIINEKVLVGPELGWGRYGKLETNDQKTTATDLLAAGRYYFNERMDVIGKVGLAYVDGDGDKNTVPMTGVGMGYDINSKLNANVTYYHTYGQRDDLDRTDSVFVGVSYFFQ